MLPFPVLSHISAFVLDQPRKPLWLRIVIKLSRLRVVSSATPTTISRLVPPSWMLIPVRLPRMIGSTATAARYVVIYLLLILAFNYFYVAIQYNPVEIANNLRRNNGSIPGFRPGKPKH